MGGRIRKDGHGHPGSGRPPLGRTKQPLDGTEQASDSSDLTCVFKGRAALWLHADGGGPVRGLTECDKPMAREK